MTEDPLTVSELKEMCETPEFRTPKHFDYDELERIYWKHITYGAPLYGADVSGSVSDPDLEEFNVGKLGTILDCITEGKPSYFIFSYFSYTYIFSYFSYIYILCIHISVKYEISYPSNYCIFVLNQVMTV